MTTVSAQTTTDPASQRTSLRLLVLLAIMMFLEHAAAGAWLPILQPHLLDLGMSQVQVGWIFSSLAVMSLLAPWLASYLSDRHIAAEHVLAVCHLCGAVLLWVAASLTTFWPLMFCLFAFATVYVPTLALTNLIAFRHLADFAREFGYVRLWGTMSWVVVAMVVWLWLDPPDWLRFAGAHTTSDALRFGGILALILGVYSFWLPSTPPTHRAAHAPAGLGRAAYNAAAHNRPLLVMLLVSFVIALLLPLVYPYGSEFIRSQGLSTGQVSAVMSLGQAGEVIAFASMGFLLRRFGAKTVFLIGLASWAIRFAVWSAGGPWPLLVASVPLHGFCFAFVVGVGQIIVDHQAPRHARATMQSLHHVLIYGVGALAGYQIGGWSAEALTTTTASGVVTTDYATFYFWPAIVAGLCFVAFWWGYPSRDCPLRRPAASAGASMDT